MKLNKVIELFAYLLLITIVIWVLSSIVDVNLHSQIDSKNYAKLADWNLFKLFHDLTNVIMNNYKNN